MECEDEEGVSSKVKIRPATATPVAPLARSLSTASMPRMNSTDSRRPRKGWCTRWKARCRPMLRPVSIHSVVMATSVMISVNTMLPPTR